MIQALPVARGPSLLLEPGGEPINGAAHDVGRIAHELADTPTDTADVRAALHRMRCRVYYLKTKNENLLEQHEALRKIAANANAKVADKDTTIRALEQTIARLTGDQVPISNERKAAA